MNLCGICKKPLDTGNVEDSDCGGDCLECMGDSGDPAAAEHFLKEIKKLRVELYDVRNTVVKVLNIGYDNLFEENRRLRAAATRLLSLHSRRERQVRVELADLEAALNFSKET